MPSPASPALPLNQVEARYAATPPFADFAVLALLAFGGRVPVIGLGGADRLDEYDQWLHVSFDDMVAFQARCFPAGLIQMERTNAPWLKCKGAFGA